MESAFREAYVLVKGRSELLPESDDADTEL